MSTENNALHEPTQFRDGPYDQRLVDLSEADCPNLDRISSRVRVLEAVVELYDQEQPVTPSALVRATGLKMVTIVDCIKDLRDRGEIWAPERGVYRPVIKHPPTRAVSRTTLPDGTVKLEVGDEVLTLTPRESRAVAEAMGGSAALLVAIESAAAMSEVLYLARRIVAGNDSRRSRERKRAKPAGADVLPDGEVAGAPQEPAAGERSP